MSVETVAVWENRSGPGGAGNTTRGLTHSTGTSREQAPMKTTIVVSDPDVIKRCSVPGCTRKFCARQLCNTHYVQFRSTGQLIPLPTLSTAERLWSRVVDQPNGCREFTGCLNRWGYGKISFNGRPIGAHRMAWILTNGPIPDGASVCHRCDNPPCCNPEHLFLGTQDDNMADMNTKGRQSNQQKTHCPQGHAYDEANTRVEKKGSRHCLICVKTHSAARAKRKAVV